AIINRIRDEIRRRKRTPDRSPIDSAHPDREASPLEQAIGSETLERYEEALARLKPEHREALIARVELGASYEQIAAALGKPSVAAARMFVGRALVRLAREMRRGRRR